MRHNAMRQIVAARIGGTKQEHLKMRTKREQPDSSAMTKNPHTPKKIRGPDIYIMHQKKF